MQHTTLLRPPTSKATPALASSPTIEFALRGDLDELHELHTSRRRALERSGKRGYLCPLSPDDILARLGPSSERPWGPRGLTVCTRDPSGDIVGSCFLNRGLVGSAARLVADRSLDVEPSACVTSSSLLVRRDCSGRGLGAQLHAATIALSRAQHRLHFGTVNSANARAITIYLRQGTRLLGLAPSPDQPGTATILMMFAELSAIGVELGPLTASHAVDAPPPDWLPELERDRVVLMGRDRLLAFELRRAQKNTRASR